MMQISDTGYFLKKIFEKNWKTIFLIDSIKNESYTYGDFFQKITRYREKLEEIGIKNGDYVCLILDNSLELATLYFSSLLLGVKVVPIDPLKGITPDSLNIDNLIRVTTNYKEIIIAFDPTPEGDATTLYLINLLKEFDVKITRLARGIPVGSSFDYIDEVTLTHSLEDRVEIK